MRTLTLRAVLSCMLIVLLPASMFAADSTAAMLYINGTAWLNGSSVPKSSAIFFRGSCSDPVRFGRQHQGSRHQRTGVVRLLSSV